MLLIVIYPNGERDEIQWTPQCDRDFCERCGDCLHCCADEQCTCNPDGTDHLWIEYAETNKEARS